MTDSALLTVLYIFAFALCVGFVRDFDTWNHSC